MVPAAERARDRAEPVPALELGMRHLPVAARHLAPAGDGEEALLRTRRELVEEQGQVMRGRDEAGRRGEAVGRRVARQDDAAAERKLRGMALCQRRALRQRHVGAGLPETGGVHHLALDPGVVALPGHRLDDLAGEAVAVVRVLHAQIGVDRLRLGEFLQELLGAEEGPAMGPLAGVLAIADDAGGVREQLRNSRLRHCRVQALHVAAGRIVELQLALLAQLHDAGGGEALGMRGDAHQMPRRQLDLAIRIGVAPGLLQHHLALVRDRQHATRLLGQAHLEAEPLGDVVEGGCEPSVHGVVSSFLREWAKIAREGRARQIPIRRLPAGAGAWRGARARSRHSPGSRRCR